ncbi:putative beta-lysine N-acetyltransferase [Imperialibacter roseus]|uniref:Beta-lysine N-acetyltransferase n=1 Tax=Imperialibacter roseus TaxID=1324217 RepID=A0ABZ0ISM9_9BACT|nr:putative beta-lysine N-acetyltransferase [Imperialibacter roseus]WOK07419.1 putative beta-lysine N-acetyltransferase [Imperialibacter roseus]
MITEIKNDIAAISVYSDAFNKRIRIDDYSGDTHGVLALIAESTPAWAEKIIVKSREQEVAVFLSGGFIKEAEIKKYFNGSDMFFLVKYPLTQRGNSAKLMDERKVVTSILDQKYSPTEVDARTVALAKEADAKELAELYAKVFQVYPTPLNDPAYVKKTMEEGTKYVLIREQNRIVSAASAEINRQYANAELTDCATLPEARGKGHIKKLLSKLEEILIADDIQCLYTIARAESHGMNKAFYQLGYTYGGTLINNCFIYSGLEDMNVWYKGGTKPKV